MTTRPAGPSARPRSKTAQAPAPPATYLFCLVQSDRAPSLRAVAAGPPGTGPVRLLPLERGIWVAIADAPAGHFAEMQIEQYLHDIEHVSQYALGHAAVIEYFFKRAPVLPLKLFTLFASDDRALRDLRARRDRIRRLFKLVGGHEEWGVRLMRGAGTPQTQTQRRFSVGGRAYLEAKKRQRDRSRDQPRALARHAAAALGPLSRLAARTRRRNLTLREGGRPVVVTAAFLVPVARRATWKRRVAELEALMTTRGLRLDVTGPWPPYHFVSGSGRGS